tara:strand:- start:2147 stop:3193 length:1047 start_codon:yes stop_codon:yes gene_type:complete
MKNIIIGAGFSASITKILIGKNSKIIGCKNQQNINNLNRRKNIEYNKFFSKKTYSYGSLNFKLKSGTFQDRLTLGGNSDIWGGKINLTNFPDTLLKTLKNAKIYFQKLSFIKTGTISNNKNIVQMQNRFGKIITTSDFSHKIEDGYLLDFRVKKDKIFLNIKGRIIKKVIVKNLFLCVGGIQLLDLLYRSKLIKDGDTIEFSEFISAFSLKSIYSKLNNRFTIQRFHFCRAVGHFFGVQYFSKYLKLLNFIPLCLDQNFYKKKINYKLKIRDGVIVETNNKSTRITFGKSTHFCNLRINNTNINKFLRKVSNNILGVGMVFVNQKIPGPISNDIILDINNKLKYRNKQ